MLKWPRCPVFFKIKYQKKNPSKPQNVERLRQIGAVLFCDLSGEEVTVPNFRRPSGRGTQW